MYTNVKQVRKFGITIDNCFYRKEPARETINVTKVKI